MPKMNIIYTGNMLIHSAYQVCIIFINCTGVQSVLVCNISACALRMLQYKMLAVY